MAPVLHRALQAALAALFCAVALPAQISSSPPTENSAACQRLYAATQYRDAAACFAQSAAQAAGQPGVAAAALRMQARSLLHNNDPDHAEAALRASLAAAPHTPETLYLLGHLLQQRNQPRESLQFFTEAAALQPPRAEDLRSVARDYVLLGSYRDALHWLQRAIAFDGDDADAWYDLGRVQMHEGRFAEAAQALQKSLALQPRNSRAEDNLGVCLEAENQQDAAVAAYARAVALAAAEPHPSELAYVDYGKLLNTRNAFQTALPLLKRATELNPKSSTAFAELSRALTGVGDHVAARAAMEKAVSLDEGNSRLHFQLGRLYRAAGMTAEAGREFDLSSKLYGQKSSE